MKDSIEIIPLCFILFFALVAVKYDLQMMQQNSYRNDRYVRWLKGNFFSANRLFALAMLVIVACFPKNLFWTVFAGVLLALLGWRLLKTKYKKPLVFTARAIRIYATSVLLIVVLVTAAAGIFHTWAAGMIVAGILAFLSFGVVLSANVLLMPVEKSINRHYYNDAKRILAGMPGLKVIGITGSYGKTSTKHYLYRILSEKYNVLMTPGSYNTTLGVIRTIREQMKPYHNVFIVEMGAKQRGDIREICDLVHPSVGILTAVGEQHLESFKTIENVQATKFELIDSLPPDGIAVLNDDFEYIASRPVTGVANVFRYSLKDKKADYHAEDIRYGTTYTEFTLTGPEMQPQSYTTQLAGSCNISNLLAACITAEKLGVDYPSVKLAVSQIEQVEHRLNVKRTPGGITIIDDAFNSNPQGAAMALEVISRFTSGRRIVVTPGMIELGAKQYFHNQEFGRQLAVSCDYAIVVGSYNRDAIVSGLREAGFPEEKIYRAADFTDASAHLKQIVRTGDTVLYENDLPDTFK